MLFDMPTFTRFARTAHKRAAERFSVYSFDDALEVFRLYFEWYESSLHRAHPNIRMAQIQDIIEYMPGDGQFNYDPEHYEALIPQHFETKYANCDYNINHFFSGDIRMLRFYETCY